MKSSASSWQPPEVFEHLDTGLRDLLGGMVGAVSGLSAATGVQLVGERGVMYMVDDPSNENQAPDF